jgi:APA family basic amino acid/polyamine antiporter
LSRGLGYGVAGVTLLYVLVNVAYLRVLPLEAMRTAPTTVATDVARAVFGPTGGALLHALIILSIFGAMGGLIMTLPRLYYAAAAEYAAQTTGAPGAIFRALSIVTPRSAVPAGSLLLSAAAATIALLFFGTFSRIVNFFVVPLQLNNILLVAAVFQLRRATPEGPGYRAPGYPVLPLAYIAVIGFFLVSAIAFRPYETLTGVALTMTAAPAYWLMFRGEKR